MTSTYAALDGRAPLPVTDPVDKGRLTVFVCGWGVRIDTATTCS
jgi:hypothetical protein